MVGQGIADITVLTINRQTGHAPDEQGGRRLLFDVRSMRFGRAILAGGSPGVIGEFGKERLRPTVSPLGDMVGQTGCDDTCHAGHGRRLSAHDQPSIVYGVCVTYGAPGGPRFDRLEGSKLELGLTAWT